MSSVATTPKPGPVANKQDNQPKIFKLNATHRCDRCGESSQAYIQVFLKDSGHDLLFCGHHYNKYKFDLVDIVDHTRTINEYERLDTGNRLMGSEHS